MTGVVAALAGVLASAVALARWLRVSQREHYLPGQVGRCAARWLTRRPPNRSLAAVWGLAVVVAAVAALAGAGAVALAAGVAGAALGAAFPWGMTVLGVVRLRLTPRARRQLGVAAVLLAAVLVVAGLLGLHAGLLAALAPAVAAAAVDVAALVLRPVEARLAARFRARAVATLARVGPRVVAITGSYGKTTIKNHVRELLAGTFATVASPASWNNQAGLSRTVNEHLTPGTDVLVVEMGTYGPGEIAAMVDWMRPDVAVIGAIGPVHLERMGTLAAIAEAKAEILTGARAAVLCVDDPLLDALADRLAGPGADGPPELWRVGTDPGRADLDVAVHAVSGGAVAGDGAGAGGDGGAPDAGELVVAVRGREVARLPAGALHARNVACAVAVALAVGVPERALVGRLPTLSPPASRGVPAVVDGVTIIDDTFNSNPSGARAALRELCARVPGGRRLVVTPGMVELGSVQAQENRAFAAAVDASGGQLVVVGWTNRDALLTGCPTAHTVPDRETARRWVRGRVGPGDGVLWENDLPDHYP